MPLVRSEGEMGRGLPTPGRPPFVDEGHKSARKTLTPGLYRCEGVFGPE